MIFAIKAEVRNPSADTFAFRAQKVRRGRAAADPAIALTTCNQK